MSTSCNPAPEPDRQHEVQPFPYAEVAQVATKSAGAASAEPTDRTDQEQEVARRETAARAAGRKEGEEQARAQFEAHLAQLRESVRTALVDFAQERAAYYRQVEGEIVQLALSIARKILHREAQLDPLLLAGMVRVILEKMERGTNVVVRVHPQQVSDVRSYFAHHMEPRDVPEVLEDPAVEMDHCVLQTALGTTELGAEVQLKEIEQGLLDLLAQRPRGGV